MKYLYLFKKRGVLFFALIITLCSAKSGYAQLIYQPYSYQFYQKLNTPMYSPATALHTSLKPYFISDTSALRPKYDSLMNVNGNGEGKSWLHRIFFNQHVIDVKNAEYTFYADYLPDVQIGKEFSESKTTYLNTRAFQLGGTIGSKFFFYTSAYETQGKFANYEASYIKRVGMIPGQAYDRTLTGDSPLQNVSDWSYVTAMVGFTPSKSISIAMGEDKTFIGDGYRSMLLSDYAAPYPLLRFTATIAKKVQYMAEWAYLEDQQALQLSTTSDYRNYRRKWAAFHYIDWNITHRASIGFFNALIAEEADDKGNTHGFDVNYINPVFFVNSLGPSGGAPDHTLFGFNGKYKVLDKTTLYGQFMVDQATSVNSSSKTSGQVGFRGSDLFKVPMLNYLFEFNAASAYTYSNQNPIVSYNQFSEPLAHPFGAGFKEYLGILNYSIGKFDLQGQLNYATYNLGYPLYDNVTQTTNNNYGKDITLADNAALQPMQVSTTLKYAEGTVSYLINPKFNFRIEIGGLLRQEKNDYKDTKTAMFTIGLRSSFRNLYHDF
jgi:hypothetical protein